MKNIFKCKKCKGQKIKTRTHGMICEKCELPKLIEANKPPRTGRIEEKGDREKLEKVLKEIVDIDSEGYPIGVEIINKKK